MALRLRNLMIDLSGTLPMVTHDLKVAAEQAEMRKTHWRARRPRWQPARGDRPALSPLERSERQRRNRNIARRVAAGEAIADLAREFSVQPKTIVRWARRGGLITATGQEET